MARKKRNKQEELQRTLEAIDRLPGRAPRWAEPIIEEEHEMDEEELARRHNGCTKHGFPGEKSCRKAIKNRLRKGGDTTWLRPYHCPRCGLWHMTSNKKER